MVVVIIFEEFEKGELMFLFIIVIGNCLVIIGFVRKNNIVVL